MPIKPAKPELKFAFLSPAISRHEGKTALVDRLVHNQFRSEKYLPTMGAAFCTYRGCNIMDLASEHRYASLYNSYLRDRTELFICLAIDHNYEDKSLSKLLKLVGKRKVSFILSQADRLIDADLREAKIAALKLQLVGLGQEQPQIWLCSAKTGEGIDLIKWRIHYALSEQRLLQQAVSKLETAADAAKPLSSKLRKEIERLSIQGFDYLCNFTAHCAQLCKGAYPKFMQLVKGLALAAAVTMIGLAVAYGIGLGLGAWAAPAAFCKLVSSIVAENMTATSTYAALSSYCGYRFFDAEAKPAGAIAGKQSLAL